MSRNVEMAQAAWGEQLPSWVLLLARHCDATSQAEVARRLEYSPTVVNQVLRNKYTYDLRSVEQKVMGVFEGAKVRCPVLGTIRAEDCMENQRAKYSATNSMRVKLFRACHGDCPHSLKNKPKEVA